eukprot:1198530-Rhodomonas_salina.1
MAQILRGAMAGDTALMAKRRCRTAAQATSHTPSESSASVKVEFKDEPSCSIACCEASADERASPTSSHFSVDFDDEELQAKLVKEFASSDGLPPVLEAARIRFPLSSSVHAKTLVYESTRQYTDLVQESTKLYAALCRQWGIIRAG